MAKCNPPCHQTASTDGHGHRIMVSQSGNEKFPAGTPHIQCGPCANQDCEEALAQIAKVFPNSEEALLLRFKRLKAKVEGTL